MVDNKYVEHVATTGISSVVLLSRFLHTGGLTNSIPIKSQVELEGIEQKLQCIIDLGQIRPTMPIGAIQKAYEKKMYLKVDYVLIALAFCAKQNQVNKLKTQAYTAAIEIIDNQDDFLTYINYLQKLSLSLNGVRGYGAGMRRMVMKWYNKFTPVELADMFGKHRGIGNLTHWSVIRMAHMTIKSVEPVQDEENTTVNELNPNQSTAANVIFAASTSRLPNTNDFQQNDMHIATISNDRKDVFEFIFRTGQQYLSYLATKPESGPGAKRMKQLQILKTNENIDWVKASIAQQNFSVEQIPSHMLEESVIWEIIIPSLSLKQIVKYFNTIRDFGFLNPGGKLEDTFIAECRVKLNEIKSSKLCPISMFIMMRLYENNQRYISATKIEYYEKKAKKRNIIYNPKIQMQLSLLFERSLFETPAVPARYLIVIDLRSSNCQKPVLRNKYVNCLEASVLLAYSIFEREKDVSIYTFTNKKSGDLEAIHSKLPKHSFTDTLQLCTSIAVSRTYQSLTQPIVQASKSKKIVDVFLVVVDSVARFCRQGQVPENEFAEYKKKFNEHAKYVVVNLARSTHDLKIPNNSNMTGFFEVCGFGENISKILNAVGDHRFS